MKNSFLALIGLVVLLANIARAETPEGLVRRVKQWGLSQVEIARHLEHKKNNPNAIMPSHWTGSEQDFRDFAVAISDNEVSNEARLGDVEFYGLIPKVLSHPESSRLDHVLIITLADDDTAGNHLRILFQLDRTQRGRLLLGQALDFLRTRGKDAPFLLNSLLEQSMRDAPAADISASLTEVRSESLQTAAERTLRFRHEPEFFKHIAETFNNDDPWSRIAALDMLGDRRDDKTLSLLETALQDAKAGVRRLALNILGTWGSSETRELIKKTALNHASPDTRKDALNQLPEQSTRWSLAVVESALRDTNPEVAKIAAEIQKRLQESPSSCDTTATKGSAIRRFLRLGF